MAPSVALAHQDWGEGPPVLFVHGLGASGGYWSALRRASRGYRGVAPDLLGFGRSPAPPDASYDVDSHVDALLPLLSSETSVVAHSTGGVIAAALAQRAPDRVKRLLLIGLPVYANTTVARVEVGRLGWMAKATVQGRRSARLLCAAMCRYRSVAELLAPLLVSGLPADVARDGVHHTWPSYRGTLERVLVEHPVGPDVLTAPCPVTLLHGRHDRTALLQPVERLVGQARSLHRPVELLVTEGDHQLALRRPAMVAKVLHERVLGAPGSRSRGAPAHLTYDIR